MIPEAAVEAAAKVTFEGLFDLDPDDGWEHLTTAEREPYERQARAALEAAAPHMLSHERQQTADAHRDAMVNAQTVDKLNAAIEAVLAMTCKPNSNAVPHNQPDLVPPWYSDRIRAAITEALSK